MNKQAAEINNNAIHRDAVKREIYDLLRQDGPSYCGTVARGVGIDPWQCCAYLSDMVRAGEVEYKWVTGRYSV